MRHNTSTRKLRLLVLGTLLITVELAVTAAVALSLAGHSPTPGSGIPAAVLDASATPTATPRLVPPVIEPHSHAESVTGGGPVATPGPTPAPAHEPTPAPGPASQAPAPIPAAVSVAPTDPPPSSPTPTPIPGAYRPDLSNQLYDLLNGARASNGLAAVSRNDALIASAQFYTQYLFVEANPYKLDHWLVGGPGDRAWSRGYCCAVGEILAESEGSAQGMLDLWMQSDPHRSIILDPQYKSFGVACYGGPYVGSDGNVNNPIVCGAEFGAG